MNRSTLWSGIVLLAFATTAGAHVSLQKAIPANGGVINAPPSSIELRFSEPVYLTALWIHQVNQPRQKLRSLPTQHMQQFSVGVPPLLPGIYEISWRVLGDDGHVASGKIRFTLLPGRAAAHSAQGGLPLHAGMLLTRTVTRA